MTRGTQRSEGDFFPARRDPWLALVLWGIMISTLPLILIVGITEGLFGLVLALISLLIYAGTAWLWFGTNYTIGSDALIVRCGPLKMRIKFSEVTRIAETRNLWASAALSIDRVEIRYARYNTVYVSPKDQDRFIALLSARCPDAQVVRKGEA